MTLRVVWALIVPVITNVGVNLVESEELPGLRSARVGGCYNVVDDILIHCAVIADECEKRPNISFMSAHELSALGDYKCSTDNVPLGNCKSTGQCAITKDSCVEPGDFSSSNSIYGDCTIEGRFLDGNFIPTQYGACKTKTGEITCVLTPADCFDDDIWIHPSDVEEEQNGGCRCHHVKIGVCKDTSNTNLMPSECAISVYDCHPLMQRWISAESDRELDCRLCPYDQFFVNESDLLAPDSDKYIPEHVEDSADLPSKIEDSADLPIKYKEQEDLPQNQKETIEEVEEHAIHRGEMVGLIVGLCTAFFIAIVLFLWCCGEYDGPPDVQFRTDVSPLD